MENRKPVETLSDTIPMMQSSDYKERFRAEYAQLYIRRVKLVAMMNKWDAGKLEFEPTCPRSTYDLQLQAMQDYLAILEARAAMEGIVL